MYDSSREDLDSLYCGKILLKSGADPTFDHDDMPPPVIDALLYNAVSIHIYQHANDYTLDLLTTADTF